MFTSYPPKVRMNAVSNQRNIPASWASQYHNE